MVREHCEAAAISVGGGDCSDSVVQTHSTREHDVMTWSRKDQAMSRSSGFKALNRAVP
jgi:hypothetical protein